MHAAHSDPKVLRRYHFARLDLPDLRARAPIHRSNSHTLGEAGGEQAHTLSIAEIPTHAHVANGTSATADQFIPASNFLADTGGTSVYATNNAGLAAMNAGTIATVGSSQPHLNMQPFLVLNFSIALQGIFPSQT